MTLYECPSCGTLGDAPGLCADCRDAQERPTRPLPINSEEGEAMSHRPHKCNDCGAEIESGARCASCQEAKDRREREEEERRRERDR